MMRCTGRRTIFGIAASVLALAGLAGAAQARPNPCLELASIVSNYDNTSSHGGKTAAELFADKGMLTVFAKLGQAAAHVQDHELDGIGINEVSPNADAAYAELSRRIRWLDAADLNAYSGVSLSPVPAPHPLFCTRGMLGGIYVSSNAGALVGRVADAIFISFRATNDGWDLTSAPVTPDALDWDRQDRHYKHYELLLPAISAYVAANPSIKHIYVAGDSLGAAMAQRYLLRNPNDDRLQAIVFGSPGNPVIARQDRRIWTFLNDIDPILLVPALKYQISGKRFLVHLGKGNGLPPRSIYHDPQAYVRVMEHLDRHGLGASYLRGKFGGGAITRWNAIFVRLRIVSEEPEDFAVGVPGRMVTLPGSDPRAMIGGAGSDTIIGGIGEGDLFGLGGSDCLQALNRPERLFGGAGADDFVLRGNYDAYGGTVMDFVSAKDRIVALGTLPAYAAVVDGRNFIRGTSPMVFGPTLLYDRPAGRLWFDFDGTGLMPPFLVAKFPSKPRILASDIRLLMPQSCS